MIVRLKNPSYEERLKNLGLFNTECSRALSKVATKSTEVSLSTREPHGEDKVQVAMGEVLS